MSVLRAFEIPLCYHGTCIGGAVLARSQLNGGNESRRDAIGGRTLAIIERSDAEEAKLAGNACCAVWCLF